MAFQVGPERLFGEEVGCRRWQPPLPALALRLGEALCHLLSDRAGVREDDESRWRQVMKERVQLFIEEGEQLIDPGEMTRGADSLQPWIQERTGLRLLGTGCQQMGAGEFPSGGGEDHLMGGENDHILALKTRPLGGGVKKADRFQRLVEELQTERLRIQGAEEIDDVPPHAEVTYLLHKLAAIVAGGAEVGDELVSRYLFTHHEVARSIQALPPRQDLFHGRRRRHDDDLRPAAGCGSVQC